MGSELIINVTFNEIRMALLENSVPVEFFIERKNEKNMVGNIFKGKVARIVPGMDAAFVDIGLEKSAFLYVGDIMLDKSMYDEYEDTDLELPVEVNERIEGVGTYCTGFKRTYRTKRNKSYFKDNIARETACSYACNAAYRRVEAYRPGRREEETCRSSQRNMPEGVWPYSTNCF